MSSVNFVLGVLSKYKDSFSIHTYIYIINSILGGMPLKGSVHIIIVNSCVRERERRERETKGEIQTHRDDMR